MELVISDTCILCALVILRLDDVYRHSVHLYFCTIIFGNNDTLVEDDQACLGENVTVG